MKIILRLIFVCSMLPFLFACNTNPLKVDISEIKNDIEIVRFDHELFSLPQQNSLQKLLKLHEEYPGFFDLFTYKIIRIGGIDDEQFLDLMTQFVTDTMITDALSLVENKFYDFEETTRQLNKSFKYFQYHFPEKELPTIFAYISGFNQSVVTAENIIGVSLDKYLGRDCSYYQQLSTTPQYKILNMYKEKLISDVAYAWGITEFEETNKATNLMGNMIHQGKLMYFVDALLPDMHDSLKIGYTTKQLNWCTINEAQMWINLVEKKMLYSSKRMDIIRYINDGPYTNGFPLESPARTAIWIGWQIVREYMKKHPEISVSELMQNNDYQGLLNASGYFPE